MPGYLYSVARGSELSLNPSSATGQRGELLPLSELHLPPFMGTVTKVPTERLTGEDGVKPWYGGPGRGWAIPATHQVAALGHLLLSSLLFLSLGLLLFVSSGPSGAWFPWPWSVRAR